MKQVVQVARPRRLSADGAVVGIIIVFASGLGYRALAGRYASIGRGTPIPKGTLARLPLEFGQWNGKDVELEDAIIKRTDTDDHLNRSYVRGGGHAAVSVFVGYGVNIRDLMPHRPEVCYGGAGWTLVETRSVEAAMPNGATHPFQLHRFKRGVLESRHLVVANYYIVNGEYCGDVSLLRSKAGRLRTDGVYAAQIEVAAAAGEFAEMAEEAVKAFVVESGPLVYRLLEDAVAEAAGAVAPDVNKTRQHQ